MGARLYISRRMLVGRMSLAWSQAPRIASSDGQQWWVMRRRVLVVAVVAGLGFLVARARRVALAPEPDRDPWSTEPPVALQAHAEAGAAWLEPVGDNCPPTHPVKGKLSSGIYHLPGMMAYDRTKPDRCYADAAAAEADGLRPAKR
jgi:hypothetical protein